MIGMMDSEETETAESETIAINEAGSINPNVNGTLTDEDAGAQENAKGLPQTASTQCSGDPQSRAPVMLDAKGKSNTLPVQTQIYRTRVPAIASEADVFGSQRDTIDAREKAPRPFEYEIGMEEGSAAFALPSPLLCEGASRPGAFPMGLTRPLDDNEDLSAHSNLLQSESFLHTSSLLSMDESSGILVEASLVPDDSFIETSTTDNKPTALVQANPLPDTAFFFRPKIICTVLGTLIIILALALGIVLSARSIDEGVSALNEGNLSASSSDAPTSANTLIELFPIEALPTYTQMSLQDPLSAQSRAVAWLKDDPLLASYSNSRRLQRFALATLYYSTRGEMWSTNDGWLSETDECSWFSDLGSASSICDAGIYRAISLVKNKLRGTIPQEMELLDSLVHLRMNFNFVFGPLVPQIANLIALEDLQLANAGLQGPFPMELASLTKCRKGFFHSNDFTGGLPSDLFASWTAVKDLDFGRNMFEGSIPVEIGAMVNIVSLGFDDNVFLSGELPSEFGLLTALEFLWLQGNSLTGTVPSSLGALTRLRELQIHNNFFTGALPEELCELVKKNNLIVVVDCFQVNCDCECECVESSRPLPSGLLSMPTLNPTMIPSSVNVISPTGASANRLQELRDNSLPEFTRLALGDPTSPQARAFSWLEQDPNVDDFSEKRLFHRFVLATLYESTNGEAWIRNDGWMTYTPECDWYFDTTWTASPTCLGDTFEYLVLEDNNLQGSLPLELGLLTGLKAIVLSQNFLSGEIPSTLGSISGLIELELSENNLEWFIPTELGLLTSLTVLNLQSNNLSGSIPREIGNMLKLEYLFLDTNILTGTLPMELGNLVNLLSIWTFRNDLDGSIPSSLADISRLEDLQIDRNLLNYSLPSPLWRALSRAAFINVADNLLSGTIPSQVGLLRQVVMIDFFDNLFSGTIPTEFGLLTNLEELSFVDNIFSGTIPTELGLLSNMRTLFLHDNYFHGSVPSELCNLVHSQSLDLSVDCNMVICTCNCECDLSFRL